MKSPISARFIECLDIIKEAGLVNSERKFAEALDYYAQSLVEVRKGNRDVTLEVMRKAVVKFNFNPVYLCLGDGPKFLNDNNPTGLQVLSIVTDNKDNECIVHVPVPAQAGYVEDLSDTEYIGQLPTYNLPGMEFARGTYRSFDIDGDSMLPTLESGDKVVCRYVEQDFWFTDVKENNLYVVVSDQGVVVKRINNRLRNRGFLRLVSDNEVFEPMELQGQSIREIWRVEYRITKVDHIDSMVNKNSPVLHEVEQMRKLMEKTATDMDEMKNVISRLSGRKRR